MRTTEEIRAEYTKVCAEIGDLEWQKAQRLSHICMLNEELANTEKANGESAAERAQG